MNISEHRNKEAIYFNDGICEAISCNKAATNRITMKVGKGTIILTS
ncbi:MAG TPA: hypothetical protein VNB67_08085 [Nitrososphaeraceae archaeon]|nr:hypothetical protein [Nitrososphaeraceae archaeon]